MHRTVFEFLQNNDAWEFEPLQLDKSRPGIFAALSLYSLYLWTQEPIESISSITWGNILIFSGIMGVRDEAENSASRDNAFWEMGLALEQLLLSTENDDYVQSVAKPNSWSILTELVNAHRERSEGISHAVLLLAAEFGATNYLKSHLTVLKDWHWMESSASCGCSSIFYHAVQRPLYLWLSRNLNLPSNSSVISLLLMSGADPNCNHSPRKEHAFPGKIAEKPETPWSFWLSAIRCPRRDWAAEGRVVVVDAAVTFLAAGADPTLRIPVEILGFLSDKTN